MSVGTLLSLIFQLRYSQIDIKQLMLSNSTETKTYVR